MRKLYKTIASAVLAAVLAVSAFPVAASAARVPSSETVFASPSGTFAHSIYISELSKSQAMDLKNIKSLNKSVVLLLASSQSASTYSSEYANSTAKPYSSSNKSATITFMAWKKGTSTVSFKIGKTTYKTKVTVKAYQNPGATVKISGVNGGKNIASKAKNTDLVKNLKLSKTVKDATITLAAKSGWKVSRVSFTDQGTGTYHYWSGEGVKSLKLPVGSLSKSGKYSLSVTYQDKSYNTIEVRYLINTSQISY